MPKTILGALLLGIAVLSVSLAADIEGTVVIKHKLTKRAVTASSGAYERGPAVELNADRVDDPLAYERGRVVVYLDGQLATRSVNATMEQAGRRFIPDLLVIPAGSTVSFPNMDPIFHNVFSLSKPKDFDLGNYPRGQTRTVVFAKPGIVLVNCHLHTNMAAAIVVTPNRWNTRSNADGHFTLKDVPPGKHEVVAWHKAAGFFRQTVTVGEGRGATVMFEIPLDENGIKSGPSVAQR